MTDHDPQGGCHQVERGRVRSHMHWTNTFSPGVFEAHVHTMTTYAKSISYEMDCGLSHFLQNILKVRILCMYIVKIADWIGRESCSEEPL